MKVVPALTLMVAVLSAVACGGGSGGKAPTAQPTTEAATATTPAVGRTGIESVDAVIAALEAGDVGGLVSAMRFTEVLCVATPEALSGDVACDGAPEGTMVQAMPMAQCEGANVPPDAAKAGLRQLFSERPQPEFYAVLPDSGINTRHELFREGRSNIRGRPRVGHRRHDLGLGTAVE